MQIFKSSRDAIGTAAGVAWPTFGIIFNTLGLAMGGVSAIALGSVSLGLFLIVALPIAVWSYKNYFQERRALQFNLERERRIINEILLFYLLNATKNYHTKDKRLGISLYYREPLIQKLKEKIFHDTRPMLLKKNPLFEENINEMLNNFVDIVIREKILISNDSSKIKQLKSCLNRFIKKNEKLIHFEKPPLISLIKTGTMCFTASFGSIAGCMAGLLGLLIGLGLVAGLAAVPIVGWASLGVALIFGLATAAHSVQNFRKKYKKNQVISFYKEIGNHFKNTNIIIKNAFLSKNSRPSHLSRAAPTKRHVKNSSPQKNQANGNLYEGIIEKEPTSQEPDLNSRNKLKL
jgi:hypothetical protein